MTRNLTIKLPHTEKTGCSLCNATAKRNRIFKEFSTVTYSSGSLLLFPCNHERVIQHCSKQCDSTAEHKDIRFFDFYLLTRFGFSFYVSREAAPVDSVFHTQLDGHDCVNHTLRGETEVNGRSVTNPFNKKQESKVICEEIK